MAKLRKMLGSPESPYIISLMELIETQNKITIVTWCLEVARESFLPIFEASYSEDPRPKETLTALQGWLDKEVKLAELKKVIATCNQAAKDYTDDPVAEAAVRAIAQAARTAHALSASIGMCFYGMTALAYHQEGLKEDAITYDKAANEACLKMEQLLKEMAIEDEPNPAKINWYC